MRSLRSGDAEAGAVGGTLDAIREFNTGPRGRCEQEIPVDVDVVAEARDLGSGGDPETGFDHAPEHHPEAERASGVRHPHRLANAARLRQLDRDAVRDLRARGDVAERVAVL